MDKQPNYYFAKLPVGGAGSGVSIIPGMGQWVLIHGHVRDVPAGAVHCNEVVQILESFNQEDTPMTDLHPKGLEAAAKETCSHRCGQLGEPPCWREDIGGADAVKSCPDKPSCLQSTTATLTAYLEAAVPASTWLPIESAPKDGTEVLVFEPGHPAIEDDFGFIDLAWHSRNGGGWESAKGSPEPVLWMPLPEAPRQGV